jgi:DNA repair protein RecO
MQPIHDLAIVLRSVVYEERHRIVTALSENHGQITAIAKNSIQSRRFGGTLEPFTASEWIFTQKPGAEMVTLTEAHIRKSFEGIQKDFEKLSLASTLNELMLKLAPEQQKCSDLFKLHSNALSALHEGILPQTEVAFLNAYLAKLLQWSGSQPRLLNCLQCSAPLREMVEHGELSCLIADAGWVCPSCRQQETRHIREQGGQGLQNFFIRLTPLAIVDFHMSLITPIRQTSEKILASPQEHRELFRFLESLFIYHIPGFDRHPLKSLRFLGLESNVRHEAMNLQ